MALSIKNDTAERLARQVASETGESLTEAIIHSLEERLESLRGRRSAPDLVETLMEIGRRCASSICSSTPPASRSSASTPSRSCSRAAYEKYGKGHHPAALNLGDCCSYALAVSSGQALLFKGKDFSQTDLRAAAGDRL